MSSNAKNKPGTPSLMNNIGQFVGHIVNGIKADVGEEATERRCASPATKAKAESAVVREVVQEHEAVGPDGRRMILRRRTIDEVVLPDEDGAGTGVRKAAE